MRRALALALAGVAALAALAPAASAQTAEPKTNLADIEDEVMCPVCGTTLALAEAPQAERERELIRDLIDQGLTKEQVKDELVAEFGPDVLAVPEDEGFDLAAWLIPVLGLGLAAGAVGFGLWRTRRRGDGPPAPELDPASAERLDRELSAHEP